MHKHEIWKKGLVVGIIFLFLGITIAPSINATESRNINIKSKNKGEVDLKVVAIGWWSPAPWDEDGDYLNFDWKVYNVGEEYEGEHSISLDIYFIYPDEEVHHRHMEIDDSKIPTGGLFGGGTTRIYNEKPEIIRFEVETTVTESNTDNNVLTVTVDNGVTIYGTVYCRSLLGELYPPKWFWFECNSDISPLNFDNTHYMPYTNGSYVVCAPKKAEALPFRYTVKAEIPSINYNNTGWTRSKIKFTPPLDEFEYAEIDFIFGFRGKSVNLICFDTFFRFLEQFPLLHMLLQRLSLLIA